MKTSKRIFGVALAIIMIFNVFAVATFAAGTESAVDLYLSADKAAYAQGETITLTVSEQVIAAVGDMRIGGQYPIAFDSTAFEVVSTNPDLESHGFAAIQGGYDSSMSTIVASDSEVIDDKFGWDSLLFVGVADDFATAFDATSKVDLFTVTLKVKADAPNGTYTIGFNQSSFEAYTALVNDNAMSGIYGYYDDYGYGTAANYGLNTVEITVGSFDVYHVQNQYRPNGDAYDIGVKFGFKAEDIAIAFNDKGTSENVTAVGADIYVNGVKVDKEFTSRFVYDINGDGSEYHYRVIIEGLAKDDATAYTIKPYVVYNGEPVYGEEVTVSAAAIVPQA